MTLKQRFRKALFAFFKEEILAETRPVPKKANIDIDAKFKVYDLEIDGYPDGQKLIGRLAFIWDGCIVSGWPISNFHPDEWEANLDVGRTGVFKGVKKYVVFNKPVWEL